MKAGLKRIEATLHDLGTHSNGLSAEAGNSAKRPFSFRISTTAESTEGANTQPEGDEELTTQGQAESALGRQCVAEVPSVIATAVGFPDLKQLSKTIVDLDVNPESNHAPEPNLFPQHESVQTFPAQESDSKTPSLPKLKTPSLSSHRHAANPALATNLLLEIQAHVAGWEKELYTILQQIQDIYLEGPIVNGWLESNPKEPEKGGTATLRHAEVDRLMDFVEEICSTDGKVSEQATVTGYRLCGLDAAGKLWSRPCPQDQLPSVSMAIARYQKLRQLLGRKQYLETRLSQLAQTLVALHSHIQQT